MLPTQSPLARNFGSICGSGVIATDRTGLSVFALAARNGRIDDLAKIVEKHHGIELPRGPVRVARGEYAFLGLARDLWLVVSDKSRRPDIELRNQIVDTATVVDQSDAYGLIQLSGPKLRDALLKMLPLDLHPRSFPVGRVATTIAGHISVKLWRLNDASDGSPTFTVAVERSFVRAFWLSFTEAAAEFGVTAGVISTAHL